MKKLLKDVIQQLLEAEIDEHLGREKYERDEETKVQEKNYRNGYSKKNIHTLYGKVPIDIPIERNAEFNPRAIWKYETDYNDLAKKDIGFCLSYIYMDAIHFKVRDEHRIVAKAAYTL